MRKPRDKAKVEVAVLIVERWILARLRHRRFFSLAELNAAIVGRTAAAFGHPVNPHLFRDCAATSIAIDDPQHVRIASQILGHRSAADDRALLQSGPSVEASRRYQDFLVALRQGKMTEKPELTES